MYSPIPGVAMGIEFALVHAPTEEAYDLGKWTGDPAWRAKTPTLEDVVAYFTGEWREDTGLSDEVIGRLVEDVWKFVETHPGCLLVDEHDYHWKPRPVTDDDRYVWGAGYAFRQVGCRYDITHPRTTSATPRKDDAG